MSSFGPRRPSDAVVANTVAATLGTSAFAVSFRHVQQVAAEHGQRGWAATAIAVSVELMAIAAVAEIRHRKNDNPWIAFGVLLMGVSMSLGANLATASPGVWGHVMAAWPACAFLAVAVMVETRSATASGPASHAGTNTFTHNTADTTPRTPTPAAAYEPIVRTDLPADIHTVLGIETPAQPRTDLNPTPYTPPRTEFRTAAAADVRTDPGTQDAAFPPTEPVSDRLHQAPGIPVRTQDTDPVMLEALTIVAGSPLSLAATVPVSAESIALLAAPADGEEPGCPAVRVSAEDALIAPHGATDDVLSRPSVSTGRGGEPQGAAALTPIAADPWTKSASGLLLPGRLAAQSASTLIVSDRPTNGDTIRTASVPRPRTGSDTAIRTSANRTDASRTRRTDRSASRTEPSPSARDGARTGLPDKACFARELAEHIRTDTSWRPNYPALMAASEAGRSWVEKRVSEARALAADPISA